MQVLILAPDRQAGRRAQRQEVSPQCARQVCRLGCFGLGGRLCVRLCVRPAGGRTVGQAGMVHNWRRGEVIVSRREGGWYLGGPAIAWASRFCAGRDVRKQAPPTGAPDALGREGGVLHRAHSRGPDLDVVRCAVHAARLWEAAVSGTDADGLVSHIDMTSSHRVRYTCVM